MKKSWVNNVHVEGYVFNLGNRDWQKLQVRTSSRGRSSRGRKYIKGELNVATDVDVNNVVPVWYRCVPEVWPAKHGKPERPNQQYEALLNIIQNPHTYEQFGQDAIKVRIDGEYESNDYKFCEQKTLMLQH